MCNKRGYLGSGSFQEAAILTEFGNYEYLVRVTYIH